MRKSNHENGAALLVALGFLGAMSILASAFLANVHLSINTQRLERETAIAEQLAEAALASGVAHLLADGDAYEGERNTPFEQGRYSVEVQGQTSRTRLRLPAPVKCCWTMSLRRLVDRIPVAVTS